MTRAKLQPGERVAVYDENSVGRATGMVQTSDGTRVVVALRKGRWDDRKRVAVRIEQCRRLIKRKRQEWTGRWKQIKSGAIGFFPLADPKDLEDLINQDATLREVRKPAPKEEP